MKILRWILVVPGAVVAWFIVLFLGIFTHGIAMGFCPDEQMISGMCVADWWGYTENILIITFSGLSAVAVVFTASLLAPSNKSLIALVSFVAGAMVAMIMTIDSHAWLEFTSALICGFLSLLWILRKNPDENLFGADENNTAVSE